MTEEVKQVTGITIKYADGTQMELEHYALVGFGENTWFNIMESPPTRDAKIKMNNYLVTLSNKLIEAIGM